MRSGRLFASFLGVVLVCSAVNGATYYVVTGGSDNNDGASLASPFQTIQRAADRMVAGDSCYIRGGVYRETLKPKASGTREAPIVFAPYRSEAVTISGADVIEHWTKHSGKIYRAPMAWDLGMGYNQVFVDGRLMVQARFPKMTASNTLLDLRRRANPAKAELRPGLAPPIGSLRQPLGLDVAFDGLQAGTSA